MALLLNASQLAAGFFTGENLPVDVSYQTVCADTEYAPVGRFYLDYQQPSLSVTKTQISPSDPIDCGGLVTWEIEVTNTGDAVADYVWVEDTLGDGLAYVSSQGDEFYSVDNGVNSGQIITWALDDLPLGATASLSLTAQDNGSCGNLTNSVEAWWGCGDDLDANSATNDSTCLASSSDTASLTGSRQPSLKLSSDMAPSSVPSCGTATVTLTIENNSTAAARDIDVDAALPSGLSYILGSTEINCGPGFAPAVDPNASGSDLVWYDAANLCDEIPAGGTVAIQFQVQASCYLSGASMPFTVYYSDCCENGLYQASTSHTINPVVPALSVTKELISLAPSCNGTATWQITVTNTGYAIADWVRIEDTLGGSLIYTGSNPTATQIPPDIWAWELGPLNPGISTSVEISATLNQPETCADSLRTNTARATWGCGAPDGNPMTVNGCESDTSVHDTSLVTIPDLTLSPSNITPIFTCSGDGGYSGEVRILARNNGDAPVTEDFKITLYETSTSWSVTGYFVSNFGGTLPINAGSSRTIHISSWPVTCDKCNYTFTVTLDTDNDICECREDNNSNTQTCTITIPDLVVSREDLSPSCAGDGQVKISGTVTLDNDGCGDPLMTDVPMRFTLYDQAGCTGTVLNQWTETFTNVNILADEEQTFTITPRTVPLDACSSAVVCALSLHIEADYTETICECDETDNSYCADLPVDIPDLVVAREDLSPSCAGDGQVKISGTVTLDNDGCGDPLMTDVPMRFTLYDQAGCTGTVLNQWTETFTNVNILADEEQTFTITPRTVPLDACSSAVVCALSLHIEADYTETICECDETDNSYCADLPVDIPDLAILSVELNVPDACSRGTVTATVQNAGCTSVTAGIPVRVSRDATGETTLPALNPSESTQVTITLNEVLPCGSYAITATVDPDNHLCECSSANNALQNSFDVVDPDLAVHNLAVSCNGDDTFDLSAEVHNLGTEASPLSTARIYIDDNLAHETSVPELAIGESHQISFTSSPLKCGTSHLFQVVVDKDNAICECNETNNEQSMSVSCPCPALVTHKEVLQVLLGGVPVLPGTPVEPGDVIHYRLSATNVGGGAAFDVDITDTLPTEFLYVAGSTSATWPGGSYSANPTGAPGPSLSWDTSAELAPSETLTLEFQAVVTSAVVQEETYTDTMCATGTEGDGTPIPPDMSATVSEDTDPDDCSSVSQVAAAVPALSVDKEIVDVLRNGVSIWLTDQVEPGDLIHYRFTIRNVGDGTAYNVDFTDELPAGLESDTDYADGLYTVDSPVASGFLGISDGTMGTLFADISAEITGGGTLIADFYAYVTSAVQQGINLMNYATAYGEDGYGTPIPEENVQIDDIFDDDPDDVDPDDTGLALIGVGEPGLALSKEIVDALRNGVSIWPTNTVLPEDVLVYRVTVNNVGQATAYNVDFADQLPLGLEYDTTYGSGTYQVDSPTQSGTLPFLDEAFCPFNADISLQLAPGATLVIEYRVRVRPDAQPGSLLENHAEVTGDDGAGNHIPIYNPDVEDNYPDDDLTDIRVGIPALVTSKEIYIDPCGCDIPSMEPGTEFKFVLTVKNVGFSTAYGIVVDDLLPPGLIYVPKTSELHRGDEVVKIEPLVDPKGRALTWITGLSLDPGDTLRLIFSLRIEPGLAIGTKICNTMQASGVDYLGQPIPADASDYVPADVDPQDSSSLQFTIGEPPSMGPSSRREQGEGEA